jgi:hypothetical protein
MLDIFYNFAIEEKGTVSFFEQIQSVFLIPGGLEEGSSKFNYNFLSGKNMVKFLESLYWIK